MMEHGLYLRGLKRCLKARGLTYAELAKQMKMTESGVKKMLNAKDISLRRVLRICEALDISPGRIFSSAEQQGIPTVALEPAQESAFLKDRKLLAVYWLAAIEKRGLAEISKTLRTSDAVLKNHLDRLVSLGLLTRRRGGLHPLRFGKFRWADDSRLAKVLNQEWSELTLQRSLTRLDGKHRLIALRLSPASFEELRRKLDAVLDEAVQTSEREELSLRAGDLQNITALVATVPLGIFD